MPVKARRGYQISWNRNGCELPDVSVGIWTQVLWKSTSALNSRAIFSALAVPLTSPSFCYPGSSDCQVHFNTVLRLITCWLSLCEFSLGQDLTQDHSRVTFICCCISSFSVAVIKHHDQGSIQKKMLNWVSEIRGLEPMTSE